MKQPAGYPLILIIVLIIVSGCSLKFFQPPIRFGRKESASDIIRFSSCGETTSPTDVSSDEIIIVQEQ